jgi:hypothetical protein
MDESIDRGCARVVSECLLSGFRVVSEWCYSVVLQCGVRVVSEWCFRVTSSVVAVVSEWCQCGVNVVSVWCQSGVTEWCQSGVRVLFQSAVAVVPEWCWSLGTWCQSLCCCRGVRVVLEWC